MSDEARLDVLVVGPSYCDLTFTGLGALPVAGRERFADALHLTAGGSAITAIALARLGRRVALLDDVGDDPHGRVVVDALTQEGVGTEFLRRDGRGTAVTVVMPLDGDRAFLTHLPSDGPHGPLDLARALRASRPRWVHVAGTAPARTHPDLMTLARRERAKVAFDPGWHDEDLDAPDVRALARECDVLLPNRAEAVRLAGLPDVAAENAAEIALARLAQARPRGVTVVKDGARGAWGFSPDAGDMRHGSVPPVQVVDATGAGDVFDAAFLDAWMDAATLDAATLDRALTFGAAAGAAAVGRIGGATGAPKRERSET